MIHKKYPININVTRVPSPGAAVVESDKYVKLSGSQQMGRWFYHYTQVRDNNHELNTGYSQTPTIHFNHQQYLLESL